MKPAKAHENKWNHCLWKCVHSGEESRWATAYFERSKKGTADQVEIPTWHSGKCGYPEWSAWPCSTFLLFLKSTATKSCGGWVGKCKSNEHITTLSLTPGFNDTQKGGAFVSERRVHKSCPQFAFRNVGSTAVDLKQISARNENGFKSNLKR